tara:strand:+ start:3400 stop:3546 length:147 start_codon:yes stop_codon:yes gene_type:complete
MKSLLSRRGKLTKKQKDWILNRDERMLEIKEKVKRELKEIRATKGGTR